MIALFAPAAAAWDDASAEDLKFRLNRLESELSNLRTRLEEQERRSLDEELRERAVVNLYGDIGIRYHMLFEGQTETFNRPEFRIHLGIYGTAFDLGSQLLRYDMRLTSSAIDAAGKPVPTLAWQPLPGFGMNPTLSVDRFQLEYQLDRTIIGSVGRFPSPYAGTQVLFDDDYNFQGITQRTRFDRLLSDSFRRIVPRMEVVGVGGYLAENAIGLPEPTAEQSPIYLGGQVRFEIAPFERPRYLDTGLIAPEINSDIEFRGAIGIHWYQGAAKISEHLGVGYLESTTNTVGDDGEIRSKFLIGEVYAEFILLRTRRARVKTWFHGVYNFHARSIRPDVGKREARGFDAGASWGMDRFTERWDFLFSFRYFYVEADAVIPEFNDETRNTNIKGYEIELSVRMFPTLTAFGMWTLTERENYQLNGFGRESRRPGRASGQSLRFRFGIFLEF